MHALLICHKQAPLERRIKELKEEVRRLSGKPKLDLGSTKEVGEVLFQTLKLPVPHGATKGPSKNPSTANEVALRLREVPMPSVYLSQLSFPALSWQHGIMMRGVIASAF